jgi:hypothetical protein
MPKPTAVPPCANDAFRDGAGTNLRDCRGYELVSPIDKAGGDVQARLNIVPFEARQDQASIAGDEVTFSAYRPFEDSQSAPFSSQYLTRRTATGGWETEAISPPQDGEGFVSPLLAIDNLYRAFSPDLSQGWLYTYTEPVLGLGGVPKHPNIYRRDNSTGTYEACTTAAPQLSEDGTHGPQLQGFSADGDLAVFRIENKLTEDASSKLREEGRPIYQLYGCFYEGGVAKLRLISVLPDGSPSEFENTAGGPANESFQLSQGRSESLENAVSADGSKVFWTGGGGTDGPNPGPLYLRLNPGAESTASGSCEESEPDKACTVLIDAGPARFWTAAVDGSVAIFTDSSDELNEYVVSSGETLPIAEEVIGLLGSSEDASRIYFLSEDEIGGEGIAGEPNLYLYDKGAGTKTFMGTLSEVDAEQGNRVPSPSTPHPNYHSARVTPDGSTVAFMSNDPELAEEVAGYDNTDQATGLPAAEIYRFEIGGELVCVSCNRTGQRPRGREVQNKFFPSAPTLPAAALLPPWLNALYAPRVLSDDGERIFFEAFEPLVLADTNGKADVYQWEALGKGTCATSDSAFDPQSQGCVSLLSSGKSSTDSQFVDASPTGDDVFIRTASSLVGWDPGAIDIYDARVNGGFEGPKPPPEPCQGESCQPASAVPPAPAPTSVLPGPGNVREEAKPKKCPKGKHKVKRKGKVVCVKNKKKGKAGKAKASKNRRAA